MAMRSKQKIVWIGRFRGHGGFATATREYVNALLPKMKGLSIAPLEVLDPADPLRAHLARLPLEDDVFKVVNHQPTIDPEAECYFSVWEFDHIPSDWADILQKARLVLTQSTFCKDLFARAIGSKEHVHVVPYIIPAQYLPVGPANRFFPPDIFVFGSVFEWVPRKVPELTIRSFEEEFERGEPVRLVLRTDHPEGINTETLVRGCTSDDRIVLIPANIPDLAPFYRGLDAYVSCTAGEGYGQTLAEAMACGIPTIACKNGGNLDFMNDDNSYLVDVHDWSPGLTIGNELFLWRLPKVDSIRARLREAYNNWVRGKEKHKRFDTSDFRARFSPSRIGALLQDLLQSVM
ncbi:MAG: glycosyltransferase [Candidatus Sigynarchaeota archaeon]